MCSTGSDVKCRGFGASSLETKKITASISATMFCLLARELSFPKSLRKEVGKRSSRGFHNWCGWLNLASTAKVTIRMTRGLNGRQNRGTKGTYGKRGSRTFLHLSGWLNLTVTAKVIASRVERAMEIYLLNLEIPYVRHTQTDIKT
eukprot:scaffold286058_cov29-Attheya_sp.AAC.1